MHIVLYHSQLIFSETILTWSAPISGRTKGKFEVAEVIDCYVHIDGDDLTDVVPGLDARRIVIIVHPRRAAILHLSTYTVGPKRGLIYIVVQGCRLITTPEFATFKRVQVTRPGTWISEYNDGELVEEGLKNEEECMVRTLERPSCHEH